MAAVIVVKGFISFVICVAVLVTNIPVIVISRTSDRLRDDVVSKVMASLCVVDIVAGAVPSAISAIMAWHQPDAVPDALCAFQVSASPGEFALITCFQSVSMGANVTTFRFIRILARKHERLHLLLFPFFLAFLFFSPSFFPSSLFQLKHAHKMQL